MSALEKYNKDIKQLCKTYKVKRLYALGSVTTNKFSLNSDIDLIVDFEKMKTIDYADNYYNLKFSLQNIFKKPVDLLEEKALKNPYFLQAIHNQRHLIYG